MRYVRQFMRRDLLGHAGKRALSIAFTDQAKLIVVLIRHRNYGVSSHRPCALRMSKPGQHRRIWAAARADLWAVTRTDIEGRTR